MRRGCLSIAVGIASGSKSGSQTLATMGKTGHILPIAAETAPPPTPAPARDSAGRGRMAPGSFTIIEAGK